MNYVIVMPLLVSCISTPKTPFVFCQVLYRVNPKIANKNIQKELWQVS